MTIINASAATEAVLFLQAGDQFDYDVQDAGNNNATEYSWLSSGGDDIQAFGSGMDFTSDPPSFGTATLLEIDLSNNGFATPDVTISAITRNGLGGALGGARMSLITDGALAFFNELMAYDDTLIGSDFNDTMKAGGGADTLSLGAGNDVGYGGAGDDSLDGAAGNDTLYGEGDNDNLTGGDGNDRLVGGSGADDMDGGFGNDVYVVDNAADVAAEVAGGVDRVESSVTHSLSGNMENLTLTGTGAVNGTGNFRDNVIIGNVANNTLTGGSGADNLTGGDGNDRLDGGTGADTMAGGAGSDVYVVDNAGDVVNEAGGGVDRVESSVSFVLGANLENLTLTGAGAINGTGNNLANVILGNAAANVLLGLNGDDELRAGSGNDTINGGVGDDEITGGNGIDSIVGGADDDLFIYTDVAQSGPAARDIVNGFDLAGAGVGDFFDLSAIDANQTAAAGGNQAFTFLGPIQNPNPPATAAGSIWLRSEAGETIVYANVDGDNAAEMAIRIIDGGVAPGAYSSADFVL